MVSETPPAMHLASPLVALQLVPEGQGLFTYGSLGFEKALSHVASLRVVAEAHLSGNFFVVLAGAL